MEWKVKYLKEALKDLKSLDHSQRLQVLKAIDKVSQNPLPNFEGDMENLLGTKQILILQVTLKSNF